MSIMKLIEKILFYISVPKCVYCGEHLDIDDRGLCKKCKDIYTDAKERNCSICSRPLYNCQCTSPYLEAHFVHKLIKVFRYKTNESSPANELIYNLKREGRRDIVDFFADELVLSVKSALQTNEDTIITSIPRRKSAKIKYGMDHSEKLAKLVAKKLSVHYIKTLKSLAKKPQKYAESLDERIENARFKLRDKNLNLAKKTVIIIDDIVTTGASMSAAAFNLKALGAKRIIGATLSIAYKDYYIPPSTEDRFGEK